jgi:uncharacterized membrane protein (DUF4010 family)
MLQLNNIPTDFINFLLVVLFALFIGLEQRRHHEEERAKFLFGTDRTFAFLGIFGFITYLLDKEGLLFFAAGGGVVALLLGFAYAGRIIRENHFGLTTTIVALITYCLAPLLYTQPPWLVLLILVTVLVLVEIKSFLIAFSEKFDEKEFITLAIFIVIAGVILPLTPNEAVIPGIDLTPYKAWLAVVAVSTLSYFSYLLKKFVFPKSGLFFTGLLGGLYSSTATTFMLAGKTKSEDYPPAATASAILVATSSMYLRILVLAFLFSASIGRKLLVPFLILAVVSAGVSVFILYKKGSEKAGTPATIVPSRQRNPLEFRTALLFALLFVFFGVLTQYVLQIYGNAGLEILSFIVGMTDIDPFLLNLFQDKQHIAESLVITATIQATISNGFLKALYGVMLGTSGIRRYLLLGFGVIILASFIVLLFV